MFPCISRWSGVMSPPLCVSEDSITTKPQECIKYSPRKEGVIFLKVLWLSYLVHGRREPYSATASLMEHLELKIPGEMISYQEINDNKHNDLKV